jgi:hypothetical protein
VFASDPHEAGGQRVIFLSGDDADAKKEVVAFFEDAGSRRSTWVTSQQAARCSRSTTHWRAST